MSIHLSYGINPDKTKHLGMSYHTIDFITENVDPYFTGFLCINGIKIKLNEHQLSVLKKYLNNKIVDMHEPINEISITTYQFKLTIPELNRVVETIDMVLFNLKKRKRLGI